MDSSTIIQKYDTDGYVVLRRFFPPSLVSGMKQAASRIVDTLAQRRLQTERTSEAFEDEPLETRFIKLYEEDQDNAPTEFTNELHTDEFFYLLFYPPLLNLAETVLGHEIRIAPGYFLRPKAFPDDRFRSMWHQDAAYLYLGNQGFNRTDFDRIRTMNVWTPIVPVNRKNGCMQFIPGTHRHGMADHIPQPPQNYLEIDHEVLDPALQSGPVVDVLLDPGDAVLFNTLLFHQGQDNRSDKVRWSMDFRYQDARQPTLIDLKGHLVRSRNHPGRTVRSKGQWRNLTTT